MTPTQVVQSIYDAFRRGDIAHITSLVAPGATWSQFSGLPWGGSYSGPEGAASFFAKLNEAMEPTRFEVNENIESGNQVFSFGRYGGKGRVTGQYAEGEWMFRWTVNSAGQVSSYESYLNAIPFQATLAA